jgi:serine/threonine protein kinase
MWLVADQCVNRIRRIHDNFMIHRDIKPENLAVGLGKRANIIYLFDFGLVKQYRSPATKRYISYKYNKQFVGSLRYANFNTHLGIEQSRRILRLCFHLPLKREITLARSNSRQPNQALQQSNRDNGQHFS